jgi:hypothetical protein
MTRFGLTHLCWEWRKMILQTGAVYADAENEDIRFEGKCKLKLCLWLNNEALGYEGV